MDLDLSMEGMLISKYCIIHPEMCSTTGEDEVICAESGTSEV